MRVIDLFGGKPSRSFRISSWSSHWLPRAVAVVGMLIAQAAPAAVQSDWLGGTGNWSDAINWDTNPTVPNSSNADARVDNGLTGTTSSVTVNGAFTVGALTIDVGDSVSISNGESLTVVAGGFAGAGTITNNGTLSLNSLGSLSLLQISGAVSLNGTGTTTLSNTAANVISAANGTDRLTVGAGQTIQGAGSIGNGQMSLTNHGTISANQATALVLTPNGTGDFTNTSIFQATGGGTLQLGSGSFVNTGGTIQALTGSVVNLASGATITGGTLTTAGTGAIKVVSDSTLTNVTNSGSLGVNNGAILRLSGTLTNNGTLSLNSLGSGTTLSMSGPVTLNGSGTVTLSTTSANTINAANGSDRLTVGASQTIQGSGNIGNGQMALTNNGTINANQSPQLIIQPASGQDATNTATGIWEATNGATLNLSGASNGTFTNNNIIQAVGAGSVVNLTSSVSITGGTLATSTGGAIVNVSGATLSGVTLTGTFNTNNGSTTLVSNSFTNNGTFNLNSGGSTTTLEISGDLTIGGTGSINLSATSANSINSANGSSRLTLGSGQTVAGSGNIGTGQMSLTNNGTIDANSSPQLIIQPASGGDATNTATGIWEATNGATLNLSGASNGTFTNNNIIQAVGANSVVNLTSSASITGGTLATSGGGTIVNVSGATLTNVTSNANFIGNNGTQTVLAGTLTNNGIFTLNSGGSSTNILLSGDVTVNGTGTIQMSNTSANFINAAGGQAILTVGANQTIQGSGNIGNGQMALVNNGTINANQPTQLIIQPASGLSASNAGTWEASNGAILLLSGASNGTFSSTGLIEALTGSEVQLGGNPSISGTLTTVGTGVVRNLNGATLTNVTSNANFIGNNGTQTVLAGTLTNNGIFTLNSGGSSTNILLSGDVTVNGTGTIQMSNTSANTISSAGGQAVLTVGASQTIQGSGNIGNGQMALRNNGTITANQPTSLVLQPASGLDFTNNATGLIQASSGGVLTLSGASNGTFTNNGTYQANDGSSFSLLGNPVLTNNSAGALTGGTYKAISTGNPATLNLPGGNVINNAANVVMSGSGATIPVMNTLANNLSGGQLHILAGKGFGTAGALINAGTIEIGAASSINVASAQNFTQSSGTTIVDGTLALLSGGTATINGGILKGVGNVAGDTFNTGGHVAPGDSPGELTITGAYTQSSGGALDIELGGSTLGVTYDNLKVTGVATLAGTLNVSLVNSFAPTVGQTFEIMDYASHTGSFSTLNSDTGVAYTVQYNPSNAILTVTAVPEPATIGLAALALGAIALRRKRIA